MIPFTEWLLQEKQQERRGPIGAIAREVQKDDTWPQDATTIGEYASYLRSLSADRPAIEALKQSWDAYRRAMR